MPNNAVNSSVFFPLSSLQMHRLWLAFYGKQRTGEETMAELAKVQKGSVGNIIKFSQICSNRQNTVSENQKKSVRKRKQRTPAMTAGLTDQRWTLKELFRTVVIGKQHQTG